VTTTTLVFYISGHGFGHASRDIEIINAILSSRPDVRIIVRTSAPDWLFRRTVVSDRPGRFRWFDVQTDTGAFQIDSLRLDEGETIAHARTFMAGFAARVRDEVDFLRAHHATLVVADIPPLGIAAAKAAGLPAVALGNFTWDWIYAGYDGGASVADAIAQIYANSDLALRLPLHGGFATCQHIVDVPFVAQRSTCDAEETKARLGLPHDVRLVLLSFGRYGVQAIDDGPVTALDGYLVIGSPSHPLDEAAMYGAKLRYADIVNAADVVISKPGYGIIAECVAHDTALLYTSRGRFPEYDVLVREMPRFLRTRFIPHADLFAGRWQPHLDALLAAPPPAERPLVNGAAVAAELLLELTP
jgi:L-arabinokinase